MNWLKWIFKYKRVPIDFKVIGYHCRECEAECSLITKCPCKPNQKLIKRWKQRPAFTL